MAIVPLDEIRLSPRDELIGDIMMLIDQAMTDDDAHTSLTIAQEILECVELSKFHKHRDW